LSRASPRDANVDRLRNSYCEVLSLFSAMRRAGGFQRDRLVIPFQLACGSCYMCDRQLNTQCEDGAVNIVLKP